LSGLYFLLIPDFAGIAFNSSVRIFTPVAWDLIHTWSGAVMTAAAILHFGIHWNWVLKVLRKYVRNIQNWKPVHKLEPSFLTSAAQVDDKI